MEEYLNTPARIYYKNESVSPPGSHKPNTAVAQAYYNKMEGVKRLTTETGAGQWGSALSYIRLLLKYFFYKAQDQSDVGSPNYYRKITMSINIGRYRLNFLSDGFFYLDAGTMFSLLPKTIWSRFVSVDSKNRMRLALRPLLIQHRDKNILVNAGIGEKFAEKFKKIYNIDHTETITSSLEQAGLGPEDIHYVIFTHLHLDHCGGATKIKQGRSVPVFPQAHYIIQKDEWKSATHPHELTRATYLKSNIAPLQDRLILIEGDTSLARFGIPGVKIIETKGHSPGHQVVEIADDNRKAAYVSDLLPTSKHVHLTHIMAYDIDPVGVVNQRKNFLTKFTQQEYIVIWEHDQEYLYGKVEFENGRFRAKDLVFR